MENSKYGNLIRTGDGPILSCTIVNADPQVNNLDVFYVNFRKANENNCGLLFYKHANELYYPTSMEFRLIDNNILFLLEELKIKKYSELVEVLKSSYQREERKEVEFFAVVIETNSLPCFCIKLDHFNLDVSTENLIILNP